MAVRHGYAAAMNMTADRCEYCRGEILNAHLSTDHEVRLFSALLVFETVDFLFKQSIHAGRKLSHPGPFVGEGIDTCRSRGPVFDY